jgi:hypothetical protein
VIEMAKLQAKQLAFLYQPLIPDERVIKGELRTLTVSLGVGGAGGTCEIVLSSTALSRITGPLITSAQLISELSNWKLHTQSTKPLEVSEYPQSVVCKGFECIIAGKLYKAAINFLPSLLSVDVTNESWKIEIEGSSPATAVVVTQGTHYAELILEKKGYCPIWTGIGVVTLSPGSYVIGYNIGMVPLEYDKAISYKLFDVTNSIDVHNSYASAQNFKSDGRIDLPINQTAFVTITVTTQISLQALSSNIPAVWLDGNTHTSKLWWYKLTT